MSSSASVPSPSVKGTVAFRDYRTWYRVTGDPGGERPAVVAVHGGPGSTHDYLLPLARLAADGWPVVHYDQLGNGGSTHLPHADPGFWTVELFLEELDNLVTSIGIAGNYVLFGQSWGGPLCAKHAAARPAGLRGLVVANAPASYPIWLREMARLRAGLPSETQKTLLRHEADGTYESPEYLAAMRVFYDRHVCRTDPWPREFLSSFMEIYNDPTVYYTMNGPTEFHVIGADSQTVVRSCASVNAATWPEPAQARAMSQAMPCPGTRRPAASTTLESSSTATPACPHNFLGAQAQRGRADPERNRHRGGERWIVRTVLMILEQEPGEFTRQVSTYLRPSW